MSASTKPTSGDWVASCPDQARSATTRLKSWRTEAHVGVAFYSLESPSTRRSRQIPRPIVDHGHLIGERRLLC